MKFNKNIYTNKREKGITLIALIITIVLLLILAVVAISAIQGDGIFVKASQSTFLSKVKKYQEELTLYINSKELETMLKYDETSLTADTTTTPSIRDIIKSMDKADEENFIIQSGVLKYIGDSEQEKEWSEDLGLQVGYTLKRIYGNSVQNGEPSPTSPVEIQSVGDKSKNLFNKKEYEYIVGYYNDSGEFKESSNGLTAYFKNYVSIKPNTQYHMSSLGGYNGLTLAVYFYDISQNWISRQTFTATFETLKSGYTFTTPENCYFIRCQIFIGEYSTSGQYSFDADTFQIEEGSTATDYEPYGYKIPVKVSNDTDEITTNIYLNEPLRKIGDYADYIDFENKKINRCIGSVDLSSASWLFQETQNRWVTGDFAKLYKKWDSADVKLNALSEEYTVYSYNAMGASVYSEIVGLCVYGSNGNMFVRNGSTTQTPTGILYYKLATPTEETIELPDITILGSDTLTIDTQVQPSKIEK